jgi:hypothetical protein
MFGLASSAGVFGAIADMLVAIYKAAGYRLILKWVDDFLVIRLPSEYWTEQDFIGLTVCIGVPWSPEKTMKLVTVQRYIGFNWNLKTKTVSLPTEKLEHIQELLSCWLQEGSRFSAHDAASLHGKLVHISCIHVLIRPFLRSISAFSLSFTSARAKLNAPSGLRADLSWISYLLHQLPNKLPLASLEPVDLGWWGDASTSFGIGVVVNRHWAVWEWAPGFRVGAELEHDIGWAEAVAIELGLRLVIHLGLFEGRPHHERTFLVRSDNAGVVAVTNKGWLRSRTTNQTLKHVYLLQVQSGAHVRAIHVAGRENVSDALSRGDVNGFLKGFPSATTKVSLPLPKHLSDKLFAW